MSYLTSRLGLKGNFLSYSFQSSKPMRFKKPWLKKNEMSHGGVRAPSVRIVPKKVSRIIWKTIFQVATVGNTLNTYFASESCFNVLDLSSVMSWRWCSNVRTWFKRSESRRDDWKHWRRRSKRITYFVNTIYCLYCKIQICKQTFDRENSCFFFFEPEISNKKVWF